MRKLAIPALFVTLTFVTACTDSPTGVEFERPQFSHGSAQHNGPTYVLGTFNLTLSGVAVPAGVNQHPQGKGTCRNAAGAIGTSTDHTVYYNEQGRRTSSKFCEGSAGNGGGSVQCQIAGPGIPATYAAAGNDPHTPGNENLNFFTLDEGDDVLDQFVHYKHNAGATAGKGAVNFSYTCNGGSTTGEGSLALTQFGDGAATPAVPFSGNLFKDGAVAGTRALDVAALGDPVTVVTEHGVGTIASLYWQYRSRVGL